MKKLVSIVAILAMTTPAFSATKSPRPSYLTRTGNSRYDVTYSYEDKARSVWYGSVRGELAFLNFKNKYYVENEYIGKDTYSFEPSFSFNVAVGKRIDYFWRAEVEAGYITEFKDEDEGYEVSLAVPYLMANGYYDFANGLYAGAGLGVAMPKTELVDDQFKSGGNPKWGVSPMLGLMAGWSHKVNDSLILDLRYRLAGFMGNEQERTWLAGSMIDTNGDGIADLNVGGQHFKDKMGLVLDNSISVGLRYEF